MVQIYRKVHIIIIIIIVVVVVVKILKIYILQDFLDFSNNLFSCILVPFYINMNTISQ